MYPGSYLSTDGIRTGPLARGGGGSVILTTRDWSSGGGAIGGTALGKTLFCGASVGSSVRRSAWRSVRLDIGSPRRPNNGERLHSSRESFDEEKTGGVECPAR